MADGLNGAQEEITDGVGRPGIGRIDFLKRFSGALVGVPLLAETLQSHRGPPRQASLRTSRHPTRTRHSGAECEGSSS